MLRGMSNRRLVLPLCVACGIVACKEPSGPAKTAAAEPAAPKINTTIAELKPTGCEPAPKWVGLDSCHEDGYVYAVGRKTLTSSKPLANAVVAAKARAAVAKAARVMDVDARYALSDVDVLFSHHCNDDWVALGRMKKTPPPSVPACPKGVVGVAPPVPEHCPDWIARVGWKEGDKYVGVGMSKGAGDPTLAPGAAKARALAAARAAHKSIVGVEGDSATLPADGMTFVEVDAHLASCQDTAYAMVTAMPKPAKAAE